MVTWWDGSVLDANGLFLDRSPGNDTLHVLLTFQWSPVPLSFRVTARCITGPAHQIHTSTMRRVRFLANSATLLTTAVAEYGNAQKTALGIITVHVMVSHVEFSSCFLLLIIEIKDPSDVLLMTRIHNCENAFVSAFGHTFVSVEFVLRVKYCYCIGLVRLIEIYHNSVRDATSLKFYEHQEDI